RAQLATFDGALAPDLPGFGPRPAPTDLTLSRAVAQACDAHGLDRVHLCGLSLGGAVAVDFALAFPERLRSLTLVDALLRGRKSDIRAWDGCVAAAREGRLADARKAWIADPLFDGARKNEVVLRALEAMAADYDGAHWTGTATSRFEIGDP